MFITFEGIDRSGKISKWDVTAGSAGGGPRGHRAPSARPGVPPPRATGASPGSIGGKMKGWLPGRPLHLVGRRRVAPDV